MRSYRMLTGMLAPILPLWLRWRARQGKEDRNRLRERFGYASVSRPPGILLWLHGASVGEATSVLLLIKMLRERFPDIKLLLTTGTVSSARLIQARLPWEVIHQYVPIDTPDATKRFIRHWRPELAFWVESELWPNLVTEANARQCFMGLINARMSARSFKGWQRFPAMIRTMLQCFDIIAVQSEIDAERLRQLGAREPLCLGNLKYDAALLPCDEAQLLALKNAIGARPVWLAASTHPGEEAMIAEAHRLLAATRRNLLTIIVPRHPPRGEAIASELRKHWKVARRAQNEALFADTQFYLADTLGELGLFYRLSEIVFMGGSLVNHGGQNPLEAARLACAVLTGPHTQHFTAMYVEMLAAHACLRVGNAAQLAAQVGRLLDDFKSRDALQLAAKQWVESQGGAAQRLLDLLEPALMVRPRTHAA